MSSEMIHSEKVRIYQNKKKAANINKEQLVRVVYKFKEKVRVM